jgi:hypothetical protein
MVTLQQGQWVRHPKRPEWGIGKVLGQDGKTVHIFFEQVGKKDINTQYVDLEVAGAPAKVSYQGARIHVRPGVDMKKLEALCLLFHEEMKGNRKGFDDGGMGLHVLRDMKERGDLTGSTKRQLFAWCHTEGSVFQRGVDMAQQICREVYGRVPTKQEVR